MVTTLQQASDTALTHTQTETSDARVSGLDVLSQAVGIGVVAGLRAATPSLVLTRAY